MSASAKSAVAIGFLTAVEHAEFGIFGGYLVLNAAGRPLEFHCTAPVKATRAQEILYGPTLQEYLHEQIAPALLAKGKTAPILVCTDAAAMLTAATSQPAPLLLVLSGEQQLPRDGFVPLALGKSSAVVPLARAGEIPEIEQRWNAAQAGSLDLNEPFARIREALEEAQKSARAAA